MNWSKSGNINTTVETVLSFSSEKLHNKSILYSTSSKKIMFPVPHRLFVLFVYYKKTSFNGKSTSAVFV